MTLDFSHADNTAMSGWQRVREKESEMHIGVATLQFCVRMAEWGIFVLRGLGVSSTPSYLWIGRRISYYCYKTFLILLRQCIIHYLWGVLCVPHNKCWVLVSAGICLFVSYISDLLPMERMNFSFLGVNILQVQAVLLLLGGCEVPTGLSSSTLPCQHDDRVLCNFQLEY